MTRRRRRAALPLSVCTGVLLLLFGAVIADTTTKGPPTVPEKPFAVNASEALSTPGKNRTILTAPVDSSGKDVETVHEERAKDAGAEDEEKVAMPIVEESVVQTGIRSPYESGRLSTVVDSTNGGSRLEEIVHGTTGKSSSTKTVSEDSHRLSGTNGLTTVTGKPASEESSLDEKKRNNTIPYPRSEGYTQQTSKASSAERDLESQAGQTRSRGQRVNSALNLETVDREQQDTSAEKAHITEQQFLERRKKTDRETSSTKNSEVTDLQKADGNDENHGSSVSLINDTYVNYSTRDKTSTEKSVHVGGLGNQSRTVENNVTVSGFGGDAVTRDTRHPKEEVEVVEGGVTHPVIQRIVESSRGPTPKDVSPDADEPSGGSSSRNVTSPGDLAKVHDERQESASRLKLSQSTTGESTDREESILSSSSSPVPRGRTIAFSGVNEFPSSETKPTVVPRLDASAARRNISADELAEQKPYPYVKSSVKEPFHNDTSSSNQLDATTEEVSALENTIVRGRSDEKFAVTEASDVLENSIQQFKPTVYREKSGNGSSSIASSSTETRSSVSTLTTTTTTTTTESTTTRHVSMDSANGTIILDKSNDLKGITGFVETSKSAGNDVPRWTDEDGETIGEKGHFDVTGNGITEVSLKPEIVDKRTQGALPPREVVEGTTIVTVSITESQTEPGILSSVDVQTNAEDSSLIRSSLNATELSTEYPLIKGNLSGKEKSTGVTSSSSSSSSSSASPPVDVTSTTVTINMTEHVTLLPAIVTTVEGTSTKNVGEPSSRFSDTNPTNEIPSGVSGTFGPDENVQPTVTSVEYEFVGLTEPTTIVGRNATDESTVDKHRSQSDVPATTQTIRDLPARNDASNEASTMTNDVTTATDSPSTVDEIEVTSVDDGSSSVLVTEQTVVPTSLPTQTDDFATVTAVAEAETDRTTVNDEEEVQRTTSVTESWSTSEGETVTTITVERTTLPNTKEAQPMANVTETPTEFTTTSDSGATDVTEPDTVSSTILPTAPPPRIPVSSTTAGSPTVHNVTSKTTDDTRVTPSREEITSLVRIVMEGGLHEVCPKMDQLRAALAEILKSGTNTSISDEQIMFHQDPCLESPSSTPTPSDMSLTTILVYVVDKSGKFDSSMTNVLPSLYKNSHVNFPITIHSFSLVQETIPDSGNAIAVVVVSSIAFVCLVLLAGLLFIMRKRQTRFNYGERCRPVSLDAYSLDSVSAYNSVRRKGVARSSKRSYGNPTFEDSSAIPSHPLNFAGLSSFCNDVNAINEEFAGIPQVSARIDEMPSGAEVKNRYANVIPLPETRVPLQKINNDPLSEYINASYVRGPKNATRYYIACQAPMDSTVTDFWRMIWEQQSKVIIMLTDLVENGVEKCTEYIPPSEITDCHRLYGDFQVTLKKRETKEKYAISTLQLKNLENNTFREVYHIWYLWPVNGVQSDGAGLIAVLLEARALQRGGPGPIVVHCSPGTGRTGTLIALDLGIRQYEITRTVDVPRVVYTIRRDRAGAVQTKEQYAFVYKALHLYATKLAGGVLEST